MNYGAVLRQFEGDCLTNATARPRNDGDLAVETERSGLSGLGVQSETPLFQGMKSSWALISAFVRISPLAVRTVKSRISSPIS